MTWSDDLKSCTESVFHLYLLTVTNSVFHTSNCRRSFTVNNRQVHTFRASVAGAGGREVLGSGRHLVGESCYMRNAPTQAQLH